MAQQTNDIQYIYDEDPLINSDETGQLHYLIYVKSEDVQFDSDSYKFIVPNRTGFELHQNLDEMEEEIDIDSIDHTTMGELTAMGPCELHQKLSLSPKKYLVYKKNGTFVRIPIIYKGTEKNMEMLKFR